MNEPTKPKLNNPNNRFQHFTDIELAELQQAFATRIQYLGGRPTLTTEALFEEVLDVIHNREDIRDWRFDNLPDYSK